MQTQSVRIQQLTPFVTVIGLSCVLLLSGCGLFTHKATSPTSPYYRQVEAAFDEHGNPRPGDWYIVSAPYLEHMLKDLDACYGEAK